jgi:hypothetical protein
MSGPSRAQLLLANEALKKSIKEQMELFQLAQRCTVLRNAVEKLNISLNILMPRISIRNTRASWYVAYTRSILPITTLLHQLAPC